VRRAHGGALVREGGIHLPRSQGQERREPRGAQVRPDLRPLRGPLRRSIVRGPSAAGRRPRGGTGTPRRAPAERDREP
jgi:hypothetical protein